MVSACQSVPKGSPQLKQFAYEFKPAPGKANIYIVRPVGFMGVYWRFPVKLDFTHVEEIANDTFLLAQVDPGVHWITHETGGREMDINYVRIFAEEGKNYFVLVKPLKIKLIEKKKKGRKMVKNTKLAGGSFSQDKINYALFLDGVPYRDIKVDNAYPHKLKHSWFGVKAKHVEGEIPRKSEVLAIHGMPLSSGQQIITARGVGQWGEYTKSVKTREGDFWRGHHYERIGIKWSWQKPGSTFNKAWSCIEFNAEAGHYYALSPFSNLQSALEIVEKGEKAYCDLVLYDIYTKDIVDAKFYECN